MKRGFLLSGKKSPQAKIGPAAGIKSPSERRDGSKSNQRDSWRRPEKGFPPGPSKGSTFRGRGRCSPEKTRNSNPPNCPKGGMRRGFLLEGSRCNGMEDDGNEKQCDESTQDMPECRPLNKLNGVPKQSRSGESLQSKKEVATTSTALLEFEESSVESVNNSNGQNRQSEPVVSSLLRLIEDEHVDLESGTSNCCENNPITVDDHPSVGSWIQSSSSEPSLVISPTPFIPLSNSPAKPGKPLIIELEKSHMDQEVANESSYTTKISETSLGGPHLTDYSNGIGAETTGLMNPRMLHTLPDPASKWSTSPSVEAGLPSQRDSLCFASDMSLLLTQLRHSMKCKKHRDNETPKRNMGMCLNNLINKRSSALIKSFVVKHRCERSKAYPLGPHLDKMWKMLLEPIAQDYTENMQSQKKKKRNSDTFFSPPLAVGLGVVELLKPSGVAYESLAEILIGAVRAITSPNIPNETINGDEPENPNLEAQMKQNKQQKVMALGAVYFVRCRIHCNGFTMTHLGDGIDPSNVLYYDEEGMKAFLKDIESEVGILLSRILPALESIVSSNAREGRTILMVAAADACFELIQMSSRTAVLQHTLHAPVTPGGSNTLLASKSHQIWQDILPLTERLLAVKRRWVLRCDKPEHADSELGPSRVKCAMSVLNDWSDVVQTSKRLFFDHFVGGRWDGEGADFTAGLDLFWNLSGISLRRADSADSSQEAIFRVGGIAQSLCQSQECILSSFFTSPLHVLGSNAESEDLISLLQDSAKLTDSAGAGTKEVQLSEAWSKVNQQRTAIRAFASWLSRGRKAPRILIKCTKKRLGTAVNLLDSAMSSLIVFLRSESKQCIDMSVSTLSMLWSVSPDWVPEELLSDKITHPQSFMDLLDALHMHSSKLSPVENKSIVDSTSQALTIIVAKVALRRPKLLLPYILKMKGKVEIIIEVVLNMLEELPNSPPASRDPQNGNPNDNFIHHAASKMLMQNIESVPYLRLRILSNPSLFSNVPCEVIIPQILEHLGTHYAERKYPTSASVLPGLFCNIMKVKVNTGHADDFIGCVARSLQVIEENEPSQRPPVAEDKTQTATFLSKNGPLWRSALLKDSTSSDSAYKDILLATAKSMIETPSSNTPLALLASLVDDQFHAEPSDNENKDQLGKRISAATSGIIQFAMHHITLSRKENNVIKENETIFIRLAPLLLLRRLPRSYYRTVHKVLSIEKDTKDIIVDLANLFSHSLKSGQISLAKEERKLLAELAGHCLPFSSKATDSKVSPVSLFENICRGPFGETLEALRGDLLDEIHSIHEAKAAIYAISYSVPLALDKDDGEALHNAASFAFEVLKYQPRLAIAMPTGDKVGLFWKEVMMLQSGCTHFLAVGLDSMSCRKTKTIEQNEHTPLIVELHCPRASNETKARNAHSVLDALSKMFSTIQSIIMIGEIEWKMLYHELYIFPLPSIEGAHTIQFPPSSRTAMLNSFVILSQSSRAKDSKLDWLASNALPPLIDLASEGPVDSCVHHPLCIAAALQVIYMLLARCGSFDWLSSYPNNFSQPEFVCRALKCALKSFRMDEGGGPTIGTLRLAALKVILTIIALNQAGESKSEHALRGYLSPAETQQAMSILHGAANVDQNMEVRQLANQIIPYLA